MSLFTRHSAERRANDLGALLLAERTAQRFDGSNAVSNESARRASTVWACTRLKADLISTFPVDVYRRTRAARVEIDPPAWFAEPSPGMEMIQWLDAVSMSLDYDGNAFGIITPGNDGWPVAVTLVDPSAVRVKRDADGLPEYTIDRVMVPRAFVWHVKGPSWPGEVRGLSPIGYARRSINIALEGRKYIDQFFSDGGHPSMEVVVDDPDFSDADAARVKANVLNVVNGSREPWVHGNGIDTKVWQLKPADMDFLNVMQASDLDICRFLGVRQPEMVGVAMQGSSLTYQNLEQRGMSLQQYTISPHARRIEQGMSKLTPRGQVVKFNLDAIQRPDALSRTRIEDMRLRNGTWSQNDVRRIEDETPIDGGDQYVWPPGATQTNGGADASSGSTQPA